MVDEQLPAERSYPCKERLQRYGFSNDTIGKQLTKIKQTPHDDRNHKNNEGAARIQQGLPNIFIAAQEKEDDKQKSRQQNNRLRAGGKEGSGQEAREI